MKVPQIKLPSASSNGLYVGFRATPERIKQGAYVTICKRCPAVVGHWPLDSCGYEVICLKCAHAVPAIERHMEELAKERGE